MAANLTVHSPVIPVQTTSGNTPQTNGIPEKASQTFPSGAPVQLTTGYVAIWNGTTYANGILGFSNIPASNLATNGAGAPGVFGQIGGNQAIQTYGSVPNQPNAVNIALGTPITDGRTLVLLANSDTIFEIQVDASSGGTYALTQANVGTQYGITIDTGGTCYLDIAKTTVGTNTCAQVVGLNPIDGLLANGHARIVIVAPQLYA
jgi:hypothetical protein